MVKKTNLTIWVAVAAAWLLLLGVPAASADITTTVRTNQDRYKLVDVDVAGQLGVATKITLAVDQDTQVDAAFFQSKLEWLLDVRDMHGNRILPRHFTENPGHDDPKPLPPVKPTEPSVTRLFRCMRKLTCSCGGNKRGGKKRQVRTPAFFKSALTQGTEYFSPTPSTITFTSTPRRTATAKAETNMRPTSSVSKI